MLIVCSVQVLQDAISIPDALVGHAG